MNLFKKKISVACLFFILITCFLSCSKSKDDSIQDLTSTATKYNTTLYQYFSSQKFSVSTDFYTLHPNDTTKYYYSEFYPHCWFNNLYFSIGKNESDSMYLYFKNPQTASCSIVINNDYFKDSMNKASIAPFYFFATKDTLTNKNVIGIKFLDIINLQALDLSYPLNPVPEATYNVVSFKENLSSSPQSINLILSDTYATENSTIYLSLIITN